MILFFAGAHRNGSHFQKFIVEESLSQVGRSYEALDDVPFDRNDLRAVRRVLESADENKTYTCKGHWYRKKELDLLFSRKDIRVFVIWRDVFDAMVSSYFYQMRSKDILFKSFDEYYWFDVGRWIFLQQLMHRQAYKTRPAIGTSYTGLIENFDAEVTKLHEVLGISGIDLQLLKQKVSLPSLREKFGDSEGIFFRSGKIGEGRDFDFGASMKDMQKLAALSPSRLAEAQKMELLRRPLPLIYGRVSRRLLQSGRSRRPWQGFKPEATQPPRS